ncbi:MAG TPA: hypothetical protein VJ910_14505 [Desulfuromonadales bacterium]|nr:hypothetical protein [Desulfuromonadales bacterium]
MNRLKKVFLLNCLILLLIAMGNVIGELSGVVIAFLIAGGILSVYRPSADQSSHAQALFQSSAYGGADRPAPTLVLKYLAIDAALAALVEKKRAWHDQTAAGVLTSP